MSDVMIGLLILLAVVGGMAGLIWKVFFVDEPKQVASIEWPNATTLRATNSQGRALWSYDFDAPVGRRTELVIRSSGRQGGLTGTVRSDLPAPGEGLWHRLRSLPSLPTLRDEVLVAVEFEHPDPSGRVVAFDHSGRHLWQVSYSETIGPTSRGLSRDWTLKEWLVYSVAGVRHIALVFNQRAGWPSAVVVVDDSGSVRGRFANAGRIDDVTLFTTASRILLQLTGRSASRDASMLALVDALAPSGSSPEDAGSTFRCHECGPAGPLKYFVFPRSEVNVAAGFPINEVQSARRETRRQISERGFTVVTAETSPDRRHNLSEEGIHHALTARYVFDDALETLWRTSFEDDYWQGHRLFEMKGKIGHSRDQCPERNGPPLVRVWDEAKGWHEMRPR